MSNLMILFLQVTTASIIYALIFFWYVQPRLATLPFGAAVVPFLLLNGFRFLGLTLLAAGQASPSLPQGVLFQAGIGDFISAVLAIIAAIAVRQKSTLAVPLVWLFSVVGLADIVNITRIAIPANLFGADLGAMWLVLSVYLPTVLIGHVYIIYRLINRGKEVVTAAPHKRPSTTRP